MNDKQQLKSGVLFPIIFLLLWLKSDIAMADNQYASDSVTVPASSLYASPDPITRLLSGKNYRDVWAKPVKMPVFDVTKVNGGFKIVKLGGGFQTKSLRLADSTGEEWVLRTIDKNVTLAMPSFLRNTMIHGLFQEMISAAHPYAPLTIPDMARAIDIYAANPTLYFVPDDPNLEPHRAVFANKICFLERHEPTPDYSDAMDTDDALEDLVNPNTEVMQEMVLRARLLDMLLADWDRHEGQWRWGFKDSAGRKYYYAVPVDRDQAYFKSTGLMVKLASLSIVPHMDGFDKKAKDLIGLNYKSYSFDRLFMNKLDARDWDRIANSVFDRLTDSVLETAASRLPPEIYAKTGPELAAALKSRRDDLREDILRYYQYLASDVFILAKNQPEVFDLTDNGTCVTLTVYNSQTKEQYYSRDIYPGHTRFVHLFGVDEHDQIINNSKIKIVRETMKAEDLL